MFNVALDNTQGTFSSSYSTSSTDKYVLCTNPNTTTYHYISTASNISFNNIMKANTLTFSTNNNITLSLH
jgi:hypothetical protein